MTIRRVVARLFGSSNYVTCDVVRRLRRDSPECIVNVNGKRYLGDGAYVEDGSYLGELILTTHDGVQETNRIVLDASMLHVLNVYAREQQVRAAQREGDPE